MGQLLDKFFSGFVEIAGYCDFNTNPIECFCVGIFRRSAENRIPDGLDDSFKMSI